MEAAELRWNKGILEYRSLLLYECDVYRDGEPCGTKLRVEQKQYSEWQPVPIVEEEEEND